ncbi:hypothetical protein [Micrococcoides hystricis]|uniref:Lipoprotein n=1 Tax=Micrococcoides hystricis TaxID=1572761 RepID=A0ABV6P8Y4_9MICC
MKKTTPKHGKKVLATSFAAALLFATACQADGGGNDNASPEATEQQTVTEQATPTVTETETADTETDAPEESTESPENSSEFTKGDPVSTSNGGYTITPVGDWTATLNKKGEPQADGYDPEEDIVLKGPSAEGVITTGVITDLDGPPPESAEKFNSWRLEHLDTDEVDGDTYLVEHTVKDPETGDFVWMARIVTKTDQDESEYEAKGYLNNRQPSGAFISVQNTDGASGEQGLEDARGFQTSKSRDEVIEMLKTFEIEAPSQ